jgi:hypothetical protein
VTKARQHSFATSAPRGSARWLAVILARTAGVVASQHELPLLAEPTSISRKDQARPLTKRGIAQWAGQASASQMRMRMNMAAGPTARAGSQLGRHRMGLVRPGRPKNTVWSATLAPIVRDEAAAGPDGDTRRSSSIRPLDGPAARWIQRPGFGPRAKLCGSALLQR